MSAADTIGIVINVDTRNGFTDNETRLHQFDDEQKLSGTRSADFLLDGVMNKINFFRGYPVEVTVHVDLHQPLPDYVRDTYTKWLNDGVIHNLVLFKHTTRVFEQDFRPQWNDLSYVNACSMVRAPWIAHFDCDVVAFRPDESRVIHEWMEMIKSGKTDWISYPSSKSPLPIDDPSFDYVWVSTRFFFGRTEKIDRTEIVKCFDPSYLYGPKYGDRFRKCPWFEHILGILSKSRVYYPPFAHGQYLIFSWSKYRKGAIDRIERMTHDECMRWVKSRGNVSYPCDVECD